MAFAVECRLILELVRYPNVAVGMTATASWAEEISRTVSRFSESTDEVAIGIENFYAAVQGVGDVDVSVAIHRNIRRCAEISRWLVSASCPADAAQFFQLSVSY